jgi:hypothetical protein
MAQKAADYRKKMAEPKPKTKSKAKATSTEERPEGRLDRVLEARSCCGLHDEADPAAVEEVQGGQGHAGFAAQAEEEGHALLRAPRKTAAMKKKAAAEKAAPKRKTSARSRAKGRKVAAKSPDVSKMRKGANRYRIFIKAMVADGYTPAEARAIWHEEKHNYFNNPRDLTHRREALVPSSQEDYWDNSVETALLNPEYADYDDFDYGPFSTGLAHTHGVQPVNRRNPRPDHYAHLAETIDVVQGAMEKGATGYSVTLTHALRGAGFTELAEIYAEGLVSAFEVINQVSSVPEVSDALTRLYQKRIEGSRPSPRRNPRRPRDRAEGRSACPDCGGTGVDTVSGLPDACDTCMQPTPPDLRESLYAELGPERRPRRPRRNPRRSRHPIYEQTRGQFGVSEAWTHGVQPYGRRNPRAPVSPGPTVCSRTAAATPTTTSRKTRTTSSSSRTTTRRNYHVRPLQPLQRHFLARRSIQAGCLTPSGWPVALTNRAVATSPSGRGLD